MRCNAALELLWYSISGDQEKPLQHLDEYNKYISRVTNLESNSKDRASMYVNNSAFEESS